MLLSRITMRDTVQSYDASAASALRDVTLTCVYVTQKSLYVSLVT